MPKIGHRNPDIVRWCHKIKYQYVGTSTGVLVSCGWLAGWLADYKLGEAGIAVGLSYVL